MNALAIPFANSLQRIGYVEGKGEAISPATLGSVLVQGAWQIRVLHRSERHQVLHLG